MKDQNCLSHWFPRLVDACLPVPRTKIVRTDCQLLHLLDNEEPPGWQEFESCLKSACAEIGPGPWFLRTGQGSGKHWWANTCHLERLDDIGRHVANLVDWSNSVDFLGLPTNIWCVRELLATDPIATLPRYSGFPLVPEVRAFVRHGKVACYHPYWPEDCIATGLQREQVSAARELFLASAVHESAKADWLPLAEAVAAAFSDGEWSVDLLLTRRGWFVTDMAIASWSYHYPGCEVSS